MRRPVAGARLAAAQEPPSLQARLHTRVKSYRLGANDFLDALTRVATWFQLPMGVEGVEWPESGATRRRVSRSWSNVDVQQVIQDLVKGYQGYEFEVSGGIVHVFREWAKTSRQDFVNLELKTFVVRDQMPVVRKTMIYSYLSATMGSTFIARRAGM